MARSAKPLYEATLASICSDRDSVDHILRYESFEHLPDNVALDVVFRAYQRGFLDGVAHAFSSSTFMSRVLRVMDRRKDLHQLFQVLMHRGFRPVDPLLDDFRQTVDTNDPKTAAEYALHFGKFLSEAGWFSEAEELLEEALSLCKKNILLSFDLTWWLPTAVRISAVLLKVQSVFCRFSAAEETLHVAEKLASRIVKLWPNFNLAFLYTEYSLYYFLKGLYPESYEWSMQALQALTCSVNPGVAVDVLRQATKACIVCRKFQQAKLVIKEAVTMARSCFGEQSLKYADALMDYAFYLLNVDLTDQSVEVYESALEIRSRIFIGDNINVALVHEDLAYAQYVKEYSTGRFIPARTHAEYAITIMQKLLSPNHLLLASSKRIKALILEEIAIDLSDTVLNQEYLDEAEMLHQSALQLSMEAFGEMNVQTAKHYGNLGRLYQSMKKFQKAEEMHLKAIEIKENLLGSDDYEVALSVGHLASLYNYDMLEYEKAEKLYLRSVRIGLKLFGESYSGLEYDYRGLKSVYQAMGQHDKAAHYTHLLNIWKMVRESAVTYQEPPLSAGPPIKPEPIDVFIRGFFRKHADDKRIDNSSRSPNA